MLMTMLMMVMLNAIPVFFFFVAFFFSMLASILADVPIQDAARTIPSLVSRAVVD
jgi:hypothetical protein